MGRVLDPLCVFGWYTKCRYRCLHACVCLVYRADMYIDYRMGSLKQTLWWVRSSVCVCVCVLACLCVCGIQSRLVYRIGPLERTLWVRSSALVCVDRWRGHSHCWAPLTTRVDIYPRVLPSAYYVLVAGPLPLQGALNHWGRILPQGHTIQNNNLLKKSVCKNTRF